MEIGRTAGEAIEQHRALVESSGEVNELDSQGAIGLGVAPPCRGTTYASGETISVVMVGIVPVKIETASGVTDADPFITPSGTDGKFEAAASGDYIWGRVLEAPSADGDVVMAAINTVNMDIHA
jgi:hypothetical protein